MKTAPHRPRLRHSGSAMVEFTVVAPIIMLMSLGILQYGLLFFTRNQVNHAAFLAARAGSMGNARIDTIEAAYLRGLIPAYGGGLNTAEIARTFANVNADMAGQFRIQIVSPTIESFDDWADPALQAQYGARAIPNAGLANRDPGDVRSSSGQNIQDANVLKLRITHGYRPQVPGISTVYTRYLQWMDTGGDAFHTRLVNAGRIPIVTHVTLQMQSDPVETTHLSVPGMGNNGVPADPGNPPAVSTPAPRCATMACTVEITPYTPGGGAGNGNAGDNGACSGDTTTQTLAADPLFAFGSAVLSDTGKSQLDQWIASAKSQAFDSAQLTGHTDPLGSDSLNQALSLNRANAVRDYLVAHGFPDKPITTQGLGAAEPVVPLSACPSGGQAQIDCLAPNRRVTLTLQKGS